MRRLGIARLESQGFDPLARGWTVKEHEARFGSLAGAGAFPDEQWWVRNGSWHLAVDGRGTDTCWESFRRALQ